MGDTKLKYFVAISENKRKELELKLTEGKINDLQKKMLTRYWKDKIDIFDDMIRLNVKTPSYHSDRASSPSGRTNNTDEHTYTLGPMTLDAKLLSNRPVTLQKGTKQGSGKIEPVISVEGTNAVCYPSKEAKKGRKVGLNPRVLRRMEQCQTLSDTIASIRFRERREEDMPIISYRRNGSPIRRPKTSPAKPRPKGAKSRIRPETSPGIHPLTSASAEDSSVPGLHGRPSTCIGMKESQINNTTQTGATYLNNACV